MKKNMLDENLLKMSEMADRVVTDPALACVLICYMLYRVEEEVDSELLMDIAVTGGIINYFTFQEAMQSLRDSGALRTTRTDAGVNYTLTPSGVEYAKRLKTMAAKSYRDQIVSAAKRAVVRFRNKKDVKISYEPHETGCHLLVNIRDGELTLLEVKLFAPDRRQAEQLGDAILSNPSALYHDVMQAIIKRHEEPIDLSDN